MKYLLIPYMLLFLLGIIKQNAKDSILQKMTKSTIIMYNKKTNSYGSGLVVKKGSQKFILTNAHVCKRDWEGPSNYKEDLMIFNGMKEKYSINNHDKKSYFFIDTCIVKYNGIVPGYDIFNEPIEADVLKFFNVEKRDIHVTRNLYDKNFYYFNNYKINEGEINHFVDITYINGSHKKFVKYHSNQVSFKIIKGDSGSPIFNNYGEFKGLVFGTNTIQNFTVSKDSRDNVENAVLNGLITPKWAMNSIYKEMK